MLKDKVRASGSSGSLLAGDFQQRQVVLVRENEQAVLAESAGKLLPVGGLRQVRLPVPARRHNAGGKAYAHEMAACAITDGTHVLMRQVCEKAKNASAKILIKIRLFSFLARCRTM